MQICLIHGTRRETEKYLPPETIPLFGVDSLAITQIQIGTVAHDCFFYGDLNRILPDSSIIYQSSIDFRKIGTLNVVDSQLIQPENSRIIWEAYNRRNLANRGTFFLRNILDSYFRKPETKEAFEALAKEDPTFAKLLGLLESTNPKETQTTRLMEMYPNAVLLDIIRQVNPLEARAFLARYS